MSPVQDRANAPHRCWGPVRHFVVSPVVTLPGGIVAFRQKHRASLSLLDVTSTTHQGGISHCNTKENICQVENMPSCVRVLLRLSRDTSNRLLDILKRVYDYPVHILFTNHSPVTELRVSLFFTSKPHQDPRVFINSEI